MESPEQINVVRKINEIRAKILASQDRSTIDMLAREILSIAQPVPAYIDPNTSTDIFPRKNKEAALKSMFMDMGSIEQSTDIENLHEKFNLSILKLMIWFVSGGISRVNEIIDSGSSEQQ